jgi:hypothetical protein
MRVGLAAFGATFLFAGAAAAFDCPAGSYEKSEDGFSWCQPSVCENDGQCDHGQVCRPVNLCLQVGQLAEAGAKPTDAGSRLVVTQICAEDKTCPQLQTCSSFGRCLTQAQADKLAPAKPADPPAKKSSCGCEAVGCRTGASIFWGGAAVISLLALTGMRARRRRD